jgi:hypothetical protein
MGMRLTEYQLPMIEEVVNRKMDTAMVTKKMMVDGLDLLVKAIQQQKVMVLGMQSAITLMLSYDNQLVTAFEQEQIKLSMLERARERIENRMLYGRYSYAEGIIDPDTCPTEAAAGYSVSPECQCGHTAKCHNNGVGVCHNVFCGCIGFMGKREEG